MLGLAGQTGLAQDGDSTDGYRLHQQRAQVAATGVAGNLLNLCDLPRQGAPAMAPVRPVADGHLGPTKVFDNLFYVGLPNVSAWALQTSDGIILIDALNYPRDAEETIYPGLRALGLDPAQIRYVVVTHGHADHFGAAPWFQQHTAARVIASEVDWALMEGPSPFPNAPYRQPPTRDLVVGDGETLTLGDTTVTFYLTPGHSPGTLSLLIPVRDGGDDHLVALWGGTGFNFTPSRERFAIYAEAATRFAGIARAAGADVFLSNHPFVDNSPANLAILAARQPGAANPYVIGETAVERVFTVAAECALARAEAL